MMIAKLLFIVLLLTPALVQAHALWIEEHCAPQGGSCTVSVFFGEYNEGVRETTSTRLLERKATKAYALHEQGERKELPLDVANDRLKGALSGPQPVAVIDEGGEVVDFTRHGIGIVRPIFYARYAPGPVSSDNFLPFDIVPRSALPWKVAQKIEIQVLFAGKGFKDGVKAQVYAPHGWSVEGSLDAQGRFAFTPLWKGLYVLEATFKEEVPGTFQGKRYEAKRHRATLSLEVNE